MRKMKYVLNKDTGHFLLIPDIGMNHSSVPGNWTSAGFVSFDTNGRDDCGNVIVRPIVFGQSITLGLASRPEDAEIIYRGIKDEW